MYSTKVRKIGLEAEVIVTHKGKPVVARSLGLPYDGYALLGEIRGEPAREPLDAVFNLYKAYKEFEKRLPRGYKISTSPAMDIPRELHFEVMGLSEEKLYHDVVNIYGTQLLEQPCYIKDEEERILAYRANCGLHIHFSCGIETKGEEIVYGKRGQIKYFNSTTIFKSSLSTVEAEEIVRELDNVLLKKFNKKYKTEGERFRAPGYCRERGHGFEYRSLPFSTKMFLKDLEEIAEVASDTLFDATKMTLWKLGN